MLVGLKPKGNIFVISMKIVTFKNNQSFTAKKTRIELRTKFSEKIQDVFAATSRRSPLLKLNSVSACALNAYRATCKKFLPKGSAKQIGIF